MVGNINNKPMIKNIMLYTKRLCLISLSMVISFSLYTQYKTSDSLFVFAKSGLNLRSEPNAESKIVTKLKYGDWVIVEEVIGNNSTIDQRNGWWIKVKNGRNQGYIFSGYLCRINPPSAPRDSFELNYHFVEWLETLTKNDSLIHEGINTKQGSDPDGKYTYNIIWKFYASGTIIYKHIGYEWEDFSFESLNLSVNDLMNYFDFIASYRSKRSEEGKISYSLNNNEYPSTFLVKNFHGIKVIMYGNTVKIYIHLYDL